jgi:hypothetical protein
MWFWGTKKKKHMVRNRGGHVCSKRERRRNKIFAKIEDD